MLSAQENEFVTRTGPGTPMGELMRRFWMPILLPEELPSPDGAPVRVRLLLSEPFITLLFVAISARIFFATIKTGSFISSGSNTTVNVTASLSTPTC